MNGRALQGIGLVCVLLTAIAVVHTRWIREPKPMCPDDMQLVSLPVLTTWRGVAPAPDVQLRRKSELRVKGELAPDANGPERLLFHLGRGRNPSWYIVSGLLLKFGMVLPSDIASRSHFDFAGEQLPVEFREHRATSPNFVTGYFFLLDGEPVTNLAAASIRYALRNPLGPPATTFAMAVVYLKGGYEELMGKGKVSTAEDAPEQKAEIEKWLGRFYGDIRNICNP